MPRISRRRSPLPTVLLHWLLVLALTVSLATGFRIAADDTSASVSKALAPWMPQGDVFIWHLGAGLLLLGLILAYTIYQVGSGLGRRFLAVKRVHVSAWERINLVLYWMVFTALAVSAATGLMQYLGMHPVPYAVLEGVHRFSAWALIAYLPLHVLLQLAEGGVRRVLGILLPRRTLIWVGTVAGTAAVASVLAMGVADRLLLPPLEIKKVASAPLLDGVPDDPAWRDAPAVRLRLANGANLPGGETEVSLRGLHDGERVYLLCEWTDPTHSRKHVPLMKTGGDWRILQTAYRRADENRYYEDKLALMLAPANPLAAMASAHLGGQPLVGQPGAPGGRGLHYTTDGAILDVWHWKSVRNGNQGQADDNFFGPPLPAPKEAPKSPDPDSGAWFPRYTAGYRKDPPGTYSGYEMNWEYFDEAATLPLRLPEDPSDLPGPGAFDPSAELPDAGFGWIEFNDTRPYAAAPDDWPTGTLLPSVLPTGRLTGDRGDISARGRWFGGRWHLELSRRLDTGSDKDVPIADGTLLWVAVFDHSQTRHAYHLRPLRVRLE